MRVIIDTNLWISLLLKGQACNDLLAVLSDERATLVSSQMSINELTSVASRPKFRKYISERQITAVLSFILQKAQIYPLYHIPSRYRDPKDDYLLELAMVSDADYLLTGDDDLLSMHSIGKCKIITVAECRQRLITM